jgi:ABC-type sugar transport system permease subunit
VGRTLAPYGFLAPAMTLFVLFLALPIGYAAYLSLRTVKVSGLGLGKGSRTEVWAGLSNYQRALADPEFVASVVRVNTSVTGFFAGTEMLSGLKPRLVTSMEILDVSLGAAVSASAALENAVTSASEATQVRIIMLI